MKPKPRYSAWTLASFPMIACAALTARYGYDVPYWDQWWLVPVVAKAFGGDLALADLWLAVNEHRVFFPNLLTVALARLTRWDLRYEHAMTFLFAFFAFILIVRAILNAERALERRGTLWAVPILTLVLFSYTQWQNWMWGLHLMITMTAVFLVAVIVLTSKPDLSRPRFVLAAICAAVAAFSFGAGIVAWPAGLVLLLTTAPIGLEGDATAKRKRRVQCVAWALLALVAMLVYLAAFEPTPGTRDALKAVVHPLSVVLYVAAYLGSPLVNYQPHLAMLTGAVFVICAWWSWRVWRPVPPACAPFFGLVLASVFVAFLTALKQWPEGPAQALSSRYITWPSLGWCGLFALAYLSSLRSERPVSFHHAAGVVVTAFAVIAWAYGAYQADESYDAVALGRDALVNNTNSENLRWLYPEPERISAWRDTLVRHRLTVFRD